jgi:hypothetical protein
MQTSMSAIVKIVLLSGILLFLSNGHLSAQGSKGKNKKTVVVKSNKTHQAPKTGKSYKTTKLKVHNTGNSNVAVVNRYTRNKVVVVKPRTVQTIRVLPAGHTKIFFGKNQYYFHNGFYYRYYGNSYRVIAPPFGLRIKVLPVGFRTIYFGSIPHYYYRGVFYRQVNNEYVITEPEQGTVVPDLPEEFVEEVTIDGQTYFAFDNLLYKPVVTKEGVQYEVVGKLDD